MSSKANKADLGTKKFYFLARLNTLRAAGGIVVHGGMLSGNAEDKRRRATFVILLEWAKWILIAIAV